MSNKFKEINEKIETGVVEGYKKIETGVVDGYKKIEAAVVEGFEKVSDKCIDAFFTKEGESVEEAKERMKTNTKEIEAKNKELINKNNHSSLTKH